MELGESALALFSFSDREERLSLRARGGAWWKALDSADPSWLGPGSRLPDRFEGARPPELALTPFWFAVYLREAAGTGS